MIGLLIQDNAYEQDIRELLMSFYPGETYAHEVKEGVDFYVQTRLEDGEAVIGIWEKLENGEELEGWTLTAHSTGKADLSDHSATKNVIKKLFYQMLVKRTGHELPWGSLTGIRPTKIALSRLEDGWKEEDIRKFMKETYMTSDEKINLSIEIAAREKRLLEPLDYDRGYSLYVGIPFCPTTCLYCSFTSYPIGIWKKRVDAYLEALFKEIDFVAEHFKDKVLDTIYIGGGTPTSLSADQLDRLLTKIEESLDLSGLLEFTVEAGRPDSITRDKLEALHRHGIGRISINPQTMNQKTLDLIGRHHTVEQVIDSFHLAREVGFATINMDLIVGLPGEHMEDVEHTMSVIKELDPDNLTVHSLAIKRSARLNLEWDKYQDLHMENSEKHMALAHRTAQALGMEPYYLYRQKNMTGNLENIGFAKEGKAGLYNILIMEEKQSIVALGAGAACKCVSDHGLTVTRCENVKDVGLYIERIDEMIERKRELFSER